MTQDIETPVLEVKEEEKTQEEGETSPAIAQTADGELSPEEMETVYRQAKRIMESLLFCSSEPITLRRMMNVLQTYHPLEKGEVKQLLEELASEYEEQNRSFRLEEIAKGYILRTCEEFSSYIHALLKTARPEKLSHAATEVLAIIAFRQPITRPQIDEIRGVDSSGIVSTLLERQLIEPAGKLDVPGRPTLFGITKHFLKYFGLKDLKELPDMGIKIPSPPKPEPEEVQEASQENEVQEGEENDISEEAPGKEVQEVSQSEQVAEVQNSAEEVELAEETEEISTTEITENTENREREERAHSES